MSYLLFFLPTYLSLDSMLTLSIRLLVSAFLPMKTKVYTTLLFTPSPK